MTQDPSHFLNELPIWKLKIVAQAYKIDISECRYKRDYVETVRSKKLTEEQVRSALAKGKEQPTQEPPAPTEGEVRAIWAEIESIAEKTVKAAELPKREEANVERNLDECLAIRPSFFDVDSASQSAYSRMIVGDYYGAIKLNRDARMKCLETFSNAQVYSTAVSIRAADELLAKLAEDNHRIDPSLKTALAAAKKTFIGGSPRQREEALESLETLVEKAYETFVTDAEKEEGELRILLADYESFGAKTEEAHRYLEIAAQAKSAFNIAEYARLLDQAKEKAVDAKAQRAKEIDEGFMLVRAGADEAREVGADTAKAERDLSEARRAFDDGAFTRAAMILAGVERSIDDAHLAKIKLQKELEAKQLEKVNSLLRSYEPLLNEASSYGMDVRDGLRHAESARAALSNKDIVQAAKYSRRLKEIAQPVEKQVDQKRIETGAVKHVAGVKCTSCARESMYSYPDGSQKCFECGTRPSVAPQAAVQEKRTVVPRVVEVPPPPAPAARPAEAPKEEAPRKKKGFFRW